jgi:hypothetical protein
MTSSVPAPVSFSIDAAESARLRTALFVTGGGRAQLLWAAVLLLIGISNYSLLARALGWHNPLTIGPALFYVANFVMMAQTTFRQCTVRPESATMVTFDDTAMSVERTGTARATRIPFARVRSVRLTPEVIAVFGVWNTYVTIPKNALPDGGIQLLGFFSDHIVSRGMPASTSHRGTTTIVNSVSPLLARR